MSLHSNANALSFSNEKQRSEIRSFLASKRFSANGSLSPVHFGGAMGQKKEFLLPQIQKMNKDMLQHYQDTSIGQNL